MTSPNFSNIKHDMETVEFDHFRRIINVDNQSLPDCISEFFDVPGKQHYRLLSYLSTLYNNTTIIDIGSHRGNSATALSYNTTNTVYSFDIEDKVLNPAIRSLPNVQFHLDNLFDSVGADKWKDTILQSPFIFLDVDPHNGSMESDFYNWLVNIGYKGFVICDDIWYFKEMRDNFWYKIPDQQRYDLTELGHWSGTGAFTLNPFITFPKRNNSDWTLVTAYFNLTKCPDASEEILKRDDTYYLSHSLSTLALPYNLVIFCDRESYPEILARRPGYLSSRTRYVIQEFDDFRYKKGGVLLDDNFAKYRDQINENRRNKPYHFDNRNTASYYLFCLSRYAMLKETIEINPFKSSHFCWINFCIERMGYQNLIRLDEALSIKRNKFSTCYIDYIPETLVQDTAEYFRFGRCSMCSGFFTGNAEYMYKVCDLIENKFLEYVQQGYGHADEQLYSPVYFQNPTLFEHYYGDYQQMITNYTYIYDSPEPPIYNFITRSFENANYLKCVEACEFVFKSHFLKKCNISSDYLSRLYYYYVEAKNRLHTL